MARGQIQLKRLTEEEARELLEGLRWANGKACPHCGNCDQDRIVSIKANKESEVRPGLYRCKECRKQFTVTVGTVMERSKVALRDWVYVFAAICASKKGISAHQISRELGCQYKTAWFMSHRVRLAMRTEAMGKLMGTVSVDETYVGGKPRNPGEVKAKLPVVSLVEKGGRVRSKVTTEVKAHNLRKYMVENIDASATIMTDELPVYRGTGKLFAEHKKVNHSEREYVGKDGATRWNPTSLPSSAAFTAPSTTSSPSTSKSSWTSSISVGAIATCPTPSARSAPSPKAAVSA